MKAILKLCKNKDCSLDLIGNEEHCELYSSEISNNIGEFTFNHTVTINLVTKLNSDEEVESVLYLTHLHEYEEIDGELYPSSDIITFTPEKDGLYKITHIIIPKKQWINDFISEFGEDPSTLYDLILVYEEGKIYKYLEGVYSEISLDELFELNCLDNMSYFSTELYAFSLCGLMKCFYNICRALLNKFCPANCTKGEYSDLVYQRDLLWMAINVINYLIEKGDFFEALRILEQFMGCAGFCDAYNPKPKGGQGCGCSQR